MSQELRKLMADEIAREAGERGLAEEVARGMSNTEGDYGA